jgi:endonuclease YncB( thermonuclease family)
MSIRLRILFFSAFICCAAPGSTPAQAQATKSQIAKTVADFENDPCGNPLKQNSGWEGEQATVSKIIDGRTLLIAREHHTKPTPFQLVGVELENSDPSAGRAKKLLNKLLLGKRVQVLFTSTEETPAETLLVGEVWLAREGDVGLFLLKQGLAKYADPHPSSYDSCLYKRAEATARSQKVGLWAANAHAN